MVYVKRFFWLLKQTFTAWGRDRASRLAAALAYYTVFSIAPLLVIIIAMIGFFYGERAAHDEIAVLLTDLVGPDIADFLQSMLANFRTPASGIITSLIGVATLFYGATGLLYQVQEALNTIWQVPRTRENGILTFFKKRFIHLAIVLGVGAVLLLYLFAEISFATVITYLNLENLPEVKTSYLTPVLVTLLFTVLYKILPDTETAWVDVIAGAVLASLLFNVGRFVIGVYLRASTVGSIFGAAGSLVVFLVWVHYSAQIFLFGAEFTHACAVHRASRKRVHPEKVEISTLAEGRSDTSVMLEPVRSSEYKVISHPQGKQQPVMVVTPEAHSVIEETKRAAPAEGRIRSERKTLLAVVAGALLSVLVGVTWLFGKRKNGEESRKHMESDQVS